MHLLTRFIVLTLLLGTLYLGWYRWPGWYLADVSQVVRVMAGVDLVVGPVLTLVIAASSKSRSCLVRDVMMIAAVQVIALSYGGVSIWNGRPLYYAFSENGLQVVQAYDINPKDVLVAQQEQKTALIPHWYSLPRWICASLPTEATERNRIIASAVSGGGDVIDMPRYYQPWQDGLPQLREQLKKVDDVAYFMGKDKIRLKKKLKNAGFGAEQANAIPMTGRGKPLLAVFNPATLKLAAIFTAE